MHVLSRPLLDAYLRDDWVKARLMKEGRPEDHEFISQRWLLESPGKRLMYDAMYGQLFREEARRSVLDVGGGFSSLSRTLIKRHDYSLLEINAHDSAQRLRAIESGLQRPFWLEADWYVWEPTGSYDVVIANDLFPNVDQRLELFLEKFLPLCKEMCLSLTYYNVARYYKTRRIDGGQEILFMLAWNGTQTGTALKRFESRIIDPDIESLARARETVFENNRQVCILRIRGAR